MLLTARLKKLGRELSARGEVSADARRTRDGRRAQGAYFTPPPLVEFVVAETLGARLSQPVRWRRDGSPSLIVLDPAAGDGRFLAAAADLLADRAAARGFDPAAARRAAIARCLIGVERDPEFARLARARLGDGAVVHCREALLDSPVAARAVDVVVGNPPYQRSIHFSRTDEQLWRALRGRYAATSHGEWDLYAAFLEQSLEWARPGGQIGLVVPSRWLTAAFAAPLRAKLAKAGAVRAVIDFGAEQIFAGATTYASVAFLSRAPVDAVQVARYARSGWRCGTVAATALGQEPWRLAVGRRRELLDRLTAAAPPLGEVARIVKGTGTNADPVFVLADARDRPGGVVEATSRALGETVALEGALLRACLRGRDVRAYGAVDQSVRCLVPYDGDGALVPPELLARRWPRAAAYLARCRDKLEERERGRFRGETFYCFGRPQNLAFFADPAAKVVVPDVARGGRALLDERGAMVLDSAYALRARGQTGYSLALILAVLNSPMVELWLTETGVSLRGGYVRMKTAYLQGLPLPPPSPLLSEVERCALAGDAAAADEALRRAYGVTEADWGAAQ